MIHINLTKKIDESKLNSFHWSVVFLCFLITISDGYDLIVYSTVIPQLMKAWSLTTIQAGVLGSYGILGVLLGNLCFGPIADKIGRKKIIILGFATYSIFTGLAGFATSPTEFGLLRFLAGLGLGGVAPIAISLVTEYTPKAIRSTMVAIMFCGIQIGCIGGAAAAILIVPLYGWKQMFWLGFIPLLLVPILIKYLPETLNFYLMKDKVKEIRKVLKKIDPDYVTQEDERYELTTEKSSGFTVVSLFAKKRAFSSVMFWLAFFMSFWVIYGFGTWLPTIMQKAGYSIGSSLWFLVFSNIGAVIGAIFCGWLSDRLGGKKVLVVFYFMAFIFVSLLGLKVNFIILSFMVLITGMTTMGTQVAANAYVSQFYPVSMRSTGIGWALGIGKFGAVLGSTVGGVLMSMGLSLQINVFLFAIPAIISAIAMALVQERNSYSSTLLTLDQKATM